MLDTAAIHSIMESLKQDTAELMCSRERTTMIRRTRSGLKRKRELEAASDPSLRRLAEERGSCRELF